MYDCSNLEAKLDAAHSAEFFSKFGGYDYKIVFANFREVYCEHVLVIEKVAARIMRNKLLGLLDPDRKNGLQVIHKTHGVRSGFEEEIKA